MERVHKKAEQKQVTGRAMSSVQMAKVMGNQGILQKCGTGYNPYGSDFFIMHEAESAIDDIIEGEIPEWRLIINCVDAGQRPSYAPGQVMTVWRNSNPVKVIDGYGIETGEEEADCVGSKNGKVRWKPGTSRVGYWDMGHKPGSEYRQSLDQLKKGKISFGEFLLVFQNPENYRVEDPSYNRSHLGEKR